MIEDKKKEKICEWDNFFA